VKKGKLDDAPRALANVRGQSIESEYIQDELAEIIANHEYELSVVPQTTYFASWSNCFHGGLRSPASNLRRTLCGIGLQMMQQLTGINFIFYYGKTPISFQAFFHQLLTSTGVVFFTSLHTISNPFLISLITTLVNVLSTPISFWMVGRCWGKTHFLFWPVL
jgi:hypothetical protein